MRYGFLARDYVDPNHVRVLVSRLACHDSIECLPGETGEVIQREARLRSIHTKQVDVLSDDLEKVYVLWDGYDPEIAHLLSIYPEDKRVEMYIRRFDSYRRIVRVEHA